MGSVGAEIQQKILGAKPDVPDVRDYYYRPKIDLTKLPASVDLRPLCPPVYDQGLIESCTANTIGAAIEFNQMKEHARTFTPSRLFIFYTERYIGGNVDDPGKGASLRDGLKAVSQNGAPPEELWPYDEAAVCLAPTPESYAAAKLDLVTSYNRVAQHLDHIKGCLAEGYPMIFCMQTYTSLPNPSTDGVIPMPAATDEKDGWHAMLLVGYDDAAGTFLVRNSWGTGWGMAGYGTIPYAYLLDTVHISDLWTIRGVTETVAA